MWQYNYNDELYHYGVKGMKWGVRRNKPRYIGGVKSYKKAKAAAKDARAQQGAKRKLGGLVEVYPNTKAKYKGKVAGAKVYSKSISETNDYNDRVRAQRKVDRATKKLNKIEYKQAIKTRAKEIKAGENAFWRAYDSFTGAHKIQAQMEIGSFKDYRKNNKK